MVFCIPLVSRSGAVVGTAMIDAEDLPLVSGYRWGRDVQGYAVAYDRTIRKQIRMHRLILGAKRGEIADHRDRDPSNNTRANLWICTHRENMQNRGPNKLRWKGRKARVYGERAA